MAKKKSPAKKKSAAGARKPASLKVKTVVESSKKRGPFNPPPR